MSDEKIASKSIWFVLLGLGSVAKETHNGGHLKQYLNESEIDVIKSENLQLVSHAIKFPFCDITKVIIK